MATIRQKKAMAFLVENGGKSVSKAMLRAGYSKQTAKNPSKLTNSVSWKELVDEYLPDKYLLTKHNKLLEDQDPKIVAKGVELGYKLKGCFAPEKKIIETPHINLQNLSDDELTQLQSIVAKAESSSD